jgi:hemerythrin superfamily protein
MDALSLLMSQHEEVNALFEEIEATDDDDDKLALFAELANAFAAHAHIEEKIFYPAAYASATAELLNEAVQEHLEAKRTLSELLKMSPQDEQFDAKVKTLKEQIEHHVEEEEGELFPKVKKELETEELEALGAQMEEMFEADLETSPADEVPLETKKPAQIKPTKTGKPAKPGKPRRQPARE